MKKILLVLLVASIAVGAWFYGYYNHKNLDNVPSKELMVTYLKENGEEYASEMIEGYPVDGLWEVWGEPDGNLFGMYGYIWEWEEDFFIVYFDSDGIATNVKWGQREDAA